MESMGMLFTATIQRPKRNITPDVGHTANDVRIQYLESVVVVV